MAKIKKKGGPYLAAAFFCEQVVEAKDGSLSPIRIIDQINLQIPATAPADFPSKENRLNLPLTSVLSFKTGYGHAGEYTLRIIVESPQGKRTPMPQQRIELSKPPHGGANFILRATVGIYSSGLFWFHVYLDKKLMARIPVSITFERQEPEPGAQPPPANPDAVSPPHPNGSTAIKSTKRRPKK